MTEQQPDVAALARVVPAHLIGAALAGGITSVSMDEAMAAKPLGRPVPGIAPIVAGQPPPLRAPAPEDDGDDPGRGHVRDGFKQRDVLKTVAPATVLDWWEDW